MNLAVGAKSRKELKLPPASTRPRRGSPAHAGIDPNLKALKRCALGLDLYLWLAYRTFALDCPVRLTWRQGLPPVRGRPYKANDHRTVQDFRRKVLRELKKIKIAWPELTTRRPRMC